MEFKKYTEGNSLSDEELEKISGDLIQAKFDREKRNQWAQKLKDDYGVERKKQASKLRFLFSKLSVAAILVGIAGIVLYTVFLASPTLNALVDESIENLVVIENYGMTTRGDEEVDAAIMSALVAFKEKKYQESINRWQALLSIKNIKGTANYHLGLAYLQKDAPEPEEAITYLLEAQKDQRIQAETNWALAIAYLKSEQQQKAKKILEEIVQAKAYKNQKATVLLEAL
jgi:tetratricopeptide (TPR) repeat protein